MVFTLDFMAIEEKEEHDYQKQSVHDVNLTREVEGENHTLFPLLKQDNKKFLQN